MSAQNNNLFEQEQTCRGRLRKLEEVRTNIIWTHSRSNCAPVKEPRPLAMELDPYLANAENENYDNANYAKIRYFIEKIRAKRHAATLRRKRKYARRLLRAASLAKKKEVDDKISELICEMPKVNITDNSAKDFNIITGISRLTCYDKNPRQPALDMDDGSSLDSRPDLTQKLSSIHFGPSSSNDIERTIQSSSICESIGDLKIETKPGVLPDEIYDIASAKWKI